VTTDRAPGPTGPVLGVYGSPEPLWQRGETLADLGVNSVFVHAGALSEAVLARCADEAVTVYAEFGTFRGDHAVGASPELWPIGADGEPVPRTPRLLGACPSNPTWRAARLAALDELVRRAAPLGLAGVWLDYLHFHCDFELPAPTLDQSCFDDHCLGRFQAMSRVAVPDGARAARAGWILEHEPEAWSAWKCATIAAFAAEARAVATAAAEAVGARRPLMGIYSCPWTDHEYDRGLRRICGQDLDALAATVDVFSPMVYHRKCGRAPDWPGAYSAWLVGRLPGVRVWPIVDVEATTGDEARRILAEALTASRSTGEAGGVMPFAASHLAADPGRLAALRDVYR
jgi:hypothetical protein